MIRIIYKNSKSTKQIGIGLFKFFTIVVDYKQEIEGTYYVFCIHIWKFQLSLQLTKENRDAKKQIEKAIKEQKCHDAPAKG